MSTASIQQDLNLQKLYIMGTGSAANSAEMASFNGMVSASGNFNSIDDAVNQHINQLVASQGAAATIQALAKNGFGVVLTTAQAESTITELMGAGINTGAKLLHYLSTLEGSNGATLDNRAHAASSFLDTLSASDKSANFTGSGVSTAVRNLIQNIDSSSASLSNANSGLNALSANLTSVGITGTVDHYLSGSIVFVDANKDGKVSPGEWTSLTSNSGTFVVPNNAVGNDVVVYGGTDLMTGNAFQGQLSSSVGSTVVNPFTSLIQAMINSGQAGTVLAATTAIKSAFGLPANINLMSYNPLAVLASGTANATDKAAALAVQAASQQIGTVIIHAANVIDIASPSATLQSAATAVAVALGQAVAAAQSPAVTINLANSTSVEQIIQAAVTASGGTSTAAQIAQIANVTAASNAATASATNITQLAQVADVAQGVVTTSLIAGANSGSYTATVSAHTGTPLTTEIYNVTVGSVAPGVALPATASQNTATDTAAADAAAAALVAPTATLAYSINAGVTTSTTANVRDANTLRIIATFDKGVSDGTPTITINNGVLVAVTAMTKTDATHYFYDLNVPAGDIAAATVTIGGAKTATSNVISAAPSNPVFGIDNTAPSSPSAVTLTPVGGTVIANTLNTTNTNMTATATITAGQATGGTAVLKVGATTIATDSSILAGDTSVTFTLGTATTAALQSAVAAGGVVTVTVNDAAGNSAVSTVGNPTLTVGYNAITAPTGVALTSIGGTVVVNTLNSTNTNMTAVATIVAGQATGGSAILKFGSTTIATDATILVGDTTVTFNLGTADNAALKAAVAAGGVATVTLIDTLGNQAVSSLSNPTMSVDYLAAFVDLTTANDNFNGSGSNDTFTGTFGNGAGPYTFNTGDVINGLGGIDTLNITTGAEASTPPDNLWAGKTNFEKVIFQSLGNGAQVITTGAAFETAFAANGIDLTAKTLLGAIDINLTTFTGAATIKTITTGSGAHTITTGSGVSTVAATGIAAGAQTVNGVGLTTVNATINGAGDQTIGTTTGGNLTTVNATILAAGSQTIQSTSNSNVTIVAKAASGAQTITTAGGDDHITTTGAAGQTAIIISGAGDDVIIASLGDDSITGGTGKDTMTGGGGVDHFKFGTDGSVIGSAMDIITDFNKVGADIMSFGAGTAVLLTADITALVAGSNVNTTAGGLISFHATDNTFAKMVIAIQADLQLDAAGSVAMFVDSGNTYVYYAGAAAGNADDQLIQLTGITTLTTMIGGATLVIS